VAFSRSGHILAAGRGDATIQLWNAADRTHLTTLGHPLTAPNEVSAVAFSPDGHTLAATSSYSCGLDGTAPGAIQLRDVTDPARPRALSTSASAAQEGYSSVALSPDGRLLASGNSDGTLYLWDVANPAHPTALGHPSPSPTQSARWHSAPMGTPWPVAATPAPTGTAPAQCSYGMSPARPVPAP
jgi:WD40 repeat protein